MRERRNLQNVNLYFLMCIEQLYIFAHNKYLNFEINDKTFLPQLQFGQFSLVQ